MRLRMYSEAPSKDSVIWVCYIDNIEGDVFGAWIFRCAKRHWECDGSDRFNSFSAEVIEGLRRFSELLPIKTHLIEGC
jgi:hypothetical protein